MSDDDEMLAFFEEAARLQGLVHTGECDCEPWPDKCPYCGGQPPPQENADV